MIQLADNEQNNFFIKTRFEVRTFGNTKVSSHKLILIMDWRENINTIKEIYPGHFQIILDFATEAILKYILSDNYDYVWVYSYDTKDSIEWNSYELPLLNNQEYYKVLARKINFDFVQPTKEFKNILDKFNRGINLVLS